MALSIASIGQPFAFPVSRMDMWTAHACHSFNFPARLRNPVFRPCQGGGIAAHSFTAVSGVQGVVKQAGVNKSPEFPRDAASKIEESIGTFEEVHFWHGHAGLCRTLCCNLATRSH